MRTVGHAIGDHLPKIFEGGDDPVGIEMSQTKGSNSRSIDDPAIAQGQVG